MAQTFEGEASLLDVILVLIFSHFELRLALDAHLRLLLVEGVTFAQALHVVLCL